MENEEDILSVLENNENLFETEKTSSKSSFIKTEQKEDQLWNKSEFKPNKLEISKLNKTGKSFYIAYYSRGSELGEDVKDKFVKIAKHFISKGYKYRHNNNADDPIANEILRISEEQYESYLPWGGYNKNIKNPTMKRATEIGYRTAAAYHSKYSTLPASVRAILASNANAVFGVECNNPVDFILVYNENGDECIPKVKEKIDWKALGNLSFIFRLISDVEIPVFNIKNNESVKRLIEIMK